MNNSSILVQSPPGDEPTSAPSLNMSIQIIQAVLSSLVMVGSLFGNTLVICVVTQSLRMRTVTNFLIVNMACADILYTLVSFPPLFVMIFDGYEWAMSSRGLGIFFCQVVNFGQYMLVPVSVLTLAAIAFDRFFAILIPLKRIISKRVFRYLVIAIWVTSAAVAAPLLYALQVTRDSKGGLSCAEKWAPVFDETTARRDYTLVLFSVIFCLPISVMIALYSIICRHLWSIKPPGETEQEESKNLIKRRNSRRNVVKMLITVVAVFIISWLPWQIVSLIFYFQEVSISESLYFSCEIFMRASCAFNPLVYAVFSENYRQGFKKVLARCCCSKIKAFVPQRAFSTSSSRQQTAPFLLKSDYALSRREGSKKACREVKDNHHEEHQI
ncbi:RYamide receptor-like [Stylophora pistillata]|uniref:RYamide receptor-like n=1 Tax=Stylophora pistillata TaxID=50429 RepID=UPI000C04B3F5|nr:RYamide receptor-like [Stylophora pistillata]XP_022780788.1 RYamide receptor-like [Stylophora pistillata]XP_022780789.1 RYamide receptor-like [Stylophora pistillata]